MTNTPLLDVYVVDVCGTLVRDDTTLGLLRHHFERGRWNWPGRYLVIKTLTARHSPLRLALAFLEKITGQHFLKHILVRLLAGVRAEALTQSSSDYASFLLTNRRIESVRSLLHAPMQTSRVVLASASLEPVVAALASQLGVRYVASGLEQVNGVLTGRFSCDLTGRKEQALVEKYGSQVLAGRVCAISDNFSDRPMLQRANCAYVVLHKEKHRQRWQGLNATFLQVGE